MSGPSRWQTSVATARAGLSRGQPGNRPVVLASGEAFPDALAAGALAAHQNGTVLLAPRCNLDPVDDTRAFLDRAGFGYGTIVGGTEAISDRGREQATDLLSD